MRRALEPSQGMEGDGGLLRGVVLGPSEVQREPMRKKSR